MNPLKNTSIKFWLEEGTFGDRKYSRIWIWLCIDASLPWNAASEGSILKLSDAAKVIAQIWIMGFESLKEHSTF